MNRQPISMPKTTALYSRLSHDDDMQSESNSITHQKAMLENYATAQSFPNVRHYIDDGYAGTNFYRPGWKQMIEDIEAGYVGIVIVKDMSRVGRDYLQVGFHTEVMFKEHGVRFIAISNNIDTDDRESAEFAPFLNIVNEWYARDVSRKVRAVNHAKASSGKPLTSILPYGYMRDPDDKNRWLVDEPAAEVVRRIFRMAIDGMGLMQIAKALTMEKVETPSYHYATYRLPEGKTTQYDLSNPHLWNQRSISTILSRLEYVGSTVNFRTAKESYKDKRIKMKPKEDWMVFPNSHEPIIDQETFDTVQRLRDTPRRADKTGEPNPLTGLLFCADCGKKMYNSRSADKIIGLDSGETRIKKGVDFYTCSTHNLARIAADKPCTQHYVRTKVVQEVVLDTIKRVSSHVRDNEAEFADRMREMSAVQQAESVKAHRKHLARNERRIAELDTLFRKTYEDNAVGKLSDARYEQLTTGYESEQAGLRQQSAILQADLDAFSADSVKIDGFIALVRRYTEYGELTTQMLNEFVERIVVYEPDKSSGERIQDIDIHFNFLGKFDLPTSELTQEEFEHQEEQRRKREKQREANKRHYERKKAKQGQKLKSA